MGTLSEDMIDGILADSFPASDPPPWTLGRERQADDVKFLEIKNGPPENFIRDMNHLSEMIPARAYELYEKRGRQDGHALEDWIRAESELLGIVPYGILESPEHLEVDVGLPGFGTDEIEIGVEPRRIFIGVKTKRQALKDLESTDRPVHFAICRALDVPFEIIPEKVIATFKNGLLRLDLPRADRQ